MYRIAVCDDDSMFLNHLTRDIEKIMDENGLVQGMDYNIDQYDQTTGIQRMIRRDKNYYQLLLLDIELSGENGMDMARTFREQQVTSSIIFITCHRDYIYDCFDTQPLWYLLKPPDYDKLKKILLSDYRRSYADIRLAVRIEGRQMAIPFHDIYALESTQHRTRIWLAEDFYDWNGALSALKPQVPSVCFCQSHNSYMINLSHVKEILRTDVLMDNDRTFPVSRRYHDQILEKYFTYLRL